MDLPIFTHERIEELLGKDSGIGVSDTLSTNSSYCAICTDFKQKKYFLNQHTEMAHEATLSKFLTDQKWRKAYVFI